MTERNTVYSPPENLTTGKGEPKVSPLLIHNVIRNLDQYIALHYRGDIETLRDRQMTVFEDMRDFISDGETEGYVKLPTGVGKTVLFVEFIEATRLKTLIVVPTTILVDQTGKRIEKFAEDIDFGKIYGAAKQFGKEVTITTYSSLVSNVKNGKLKPEDYELLILDEFQDSRSQARTETVRKFTNAIKLGFSATPPADTFFKEIHRMSIREAVEEDLLCSFSVLIAQSDIDLTHVPITSNGEYQEGELSRAIDLAVRNQGAVDLYKKMFDGQTAIAYCVRIDHAEKVAELFREAGVPSGVISSKNTIGQKRQVLDRFESGEDKVLCNADILIKGFDEERASVCLNLRPTLSAELAEQRGGRVLRKDPNNPQKHAYIVDFIYNTENPRKLPISFAQVAEGAQILGPKYISRRSVVVENDEKSIATSTREPEVSIPGLKIITNTDEVLRIANEIKSKKIQATEVWMTLPALRRRYGRERITLMSAIQEHIESHPDKKDWVSFDPGRRGGLTTLISPELVRILDSDFLNLGGPRGWVTRKQLCKILDRSSVDKLVNEYRAKYPDWARKCRQEGRTPVTEYYSPRLVRIIKNDLGIA